MNKKRKENRYRPPTQKAPVLASTHAVMGQLEVGLKVIMMVIVVLLTTLLFIFVDNAVTQSRALSIEKITVSGNVGLSKTEIIDQSGLRPGENILAQNLRHVRKRLIAHPWIADADIKRTLPSTIDISIHEHQVIAVVEIESHTALLMNTQGQPFIENDAIGSAVYDPSSQENPNRPLPVVTGLTLTRLKNHQYGFSGKLHDAVLAVLKMNQEEAIEQIHADHETGIKVICTMKQEPTPSWRLSSNITIQLGFDQYEEKFKKIRHIVNFMQKNNSNQRICSIDLMNPENIVIKLKNRDGLPQRQQGGV